MASPWCHSHPEMTDFFALFRYGTLLIKDLDTIVPLSLSGICSAERKSLSVPQDTVNKEAASNSSHVSPSNCFPYKGHIRPERLTSCSQRRPCWFFFSSIYRSHMLSLWIRVASSTTGSKVTLSVQCKKMLRVHPFFKLRGKLKSYYFSRWREKL